MHRSDFVQFLQHETSWAKKLNQINSVSFAVSFAHATQFIGTWSRIVRLHLITREPLNIAFNCFVFRNSHFIPLPICILSTFPAAI